MSLEQALNENTAAVKQLLAAVSAGALAPRAEGKPQTENAKASNAAGPSTAAQPAAQEKTAAASSPAAAPAAGAASASTAAGETITYEQVSKVITDGVKTDKARVIEVLASFGAKKGPELKPEQYAAFIKAMTPEEALA